MTGEIIREPEDHAPRLHLCHFFTFALTACPGESNGAAVTGGAKTGAKVGAQVGAEIYTDNTVRTFLTVRGSTKYYFPLFGFDNSGLGVAKRTHE